jgi:hypothetical protein
MEDFVEWVPYPMTQDAGDDYSSIAWSDGRIDTVPMDNGDLNTIHELDSWMDLILSINYYNLFEGQSGQFIDHFPQLFRQSDGVLVLRLSRDEEFLSAFVCKSRDPAECLLSWFRGDLSKLKPQSDSRESETGPFLWVEVQEVVALIGSRLLNDVPPIVFSMEVEQKRQNAFDQKMKESNLKQVDLSDMWWYPPNPAGPGFGYPSAFFDAQNFREENLCSTLEEFGIAIGVEHCLAEDEWQRLVTKATPGTIAQKLLDGDPVASFRFENLRMSTLMHAHDWEARWKQLES